MKSLTIIIVVFYQAKDFNVNGVRTDPVSIPDALFEETHLPIISGEVASKYGTLFVKPGGIEVSHQYK